MIALNIAKARGQGRKYGNNNSTNRRLVLPVRCAVSAEDVLQAVSGVADHAEVRVADGPAQ